MKEQHGKRKARGDDSGSRLGPGVSRKSLSQRHEILLKK